MRRKLASLSAVTMILCLAFAGVAYAYTEVSDAEIGTVLYACRGHIVTHFTQNLDGSYSCETDSYAQVFNSDATKPNKLYTKCQNWDGNTLVSWGWGDKAGGELLPGQFMWIAHCEPTQWISFTANNPRVTGYHYAKWDIEDPCSTSLTVPGGADFSGQTTSTAAPIDLRNDPWIVETCNSVARFGRLGGSNVTAVPLAGSANVLPELLGHEKGVALARLFNTTLIDQYLSIGDQMPGLLVSPSGSKAVAVFLNQQGLKARVTLQWNAKIGWAVTDVTSSISAD